MDKIAETVVLKKLTFELKNRPVSPVMMKSNGRFLITRKTFVILKKSNACRNIADLKKNEWIVQLVLFALRKTFLSGKHVNSWNRHYIHYSWKN